MNEKGESYLNKPFTDRLSPSSDQMDYSWLTYFSDLEVAVNHLLNESAKLKEELFKLKVEMDELRGDLVKLTES